MKPWDTYIWYLIIRKPINNYQKAIAAAKDGSWEKERATKTLTKLENM